MKIISSCYINLVPNDSLLEGCIIKPFLAFTLHNVLSLYEVYSSSILALCTSCFLFNSCVYMSCAPTTQDHKLWWQEQFLIPTFSPIVKWMIDPSVVKGSSGQDSFLDWVRIWCYSIFSAVTMMVEYIIHLKLNHMLPYALQKFHRFKFDYPN